MSDDYGPDYEDEALQRRRDGKIDEAKRVLLERFLSS
jgi:hypothetical protein